MEARLILDAPREGAWNMAVDEALLESAAASSVPVLRFYRWSQATLSLGYFQRFGDRTLHPPSRSCPVVRRASGGGAIIHDRELTYSLAAPTTAGRRFDSRGLYDAVHGALLDVLGRWGVAATLCATATPAADGEAHFLCFMRRAPGDVLLDGVKIAGSAQRRRQGVVLQHGSLLLAASPQAPELAGVEELADQPMNLEELAQRWADCLAERLGLRFALAELTPVERSRGLVLQAEKFDATAWTKRR